MELARRIERTNQQLLELYIPLMLLLIQGRTLFEVFANLLRRPYVFSGPTTMLPAREMALWGRWAVGAFIPNNQAVADLVRSKQHLVGSELWLPGTFENFLVYHEAFKREFNRWSRDGGEYRHPGNFPAEFERDVERRFRGLMRGL